MSFDRICRLCLRESSALSSLFVDNRAQMLEMLTSIKVSQTDPSVQVCLTCLYNLKLAFEIQQNMKESDEKLKEMWRTNEIGIKTEEAKNSFFTVDRTPMRRISVPAMDKVHCLICRVFLEDSQDNNQERQCLRDIIMCNSCNSKVAFSDCKPNIVVNHQRAIPLYQCENCTQTFFHKSVYASHQKHAHPQDTKAEEEEEEEEEEKEPRAPSPFSDNNMDNIDNEDDDWSPSASPVEAAPPQPVPEIYLPGSTPPTVKIQKVGKKQKATKRPRPFACNECNKTFTCRRRLENHVHRPRKKTVRKRKPCPICGKEYDTANLSAHIVRHNPESHICELCGAKFTNKWNLRTHIYYSHSAYRYKCDRCEKIFQKHTKLTLHIKRDHDENPEFMCDTCGKKFYTRANMNAHVNNIHLKLKPHVCEFCRKCFCSKQKLNAHRKKHTHPGALYRCELCGEGFQQKVSLRSHNKVKHNIIEPITVVCKKCGKGFSSDMALLSHKRAVCF